MTASVLRFITAGSVDDGKSTLIGRLLYDSKTLMQDQLNRLEESGQNGNNIDFAGLTDGLAAEREQGITIDVAYRYFATPKRKFIIADTPGHEQYTRNMVTGASTADAAIILVDATRVDFSGPEPVLLPQTKRHSAILKLLGTPHIIVAVNKLDLLDYSEEKFNLIAKAYQKLADNLKLNDIRFVPISALQGDNIVSLSSKMPWYQGEPLLRLLEELPTKQLEAQNDKHAYFSVQRVARQDGSAADDFRGYQGRLEQGRLSVGQKVRVEPSGTQSTISSIYSPVGAVQFATAGDVLTITLSDDIDISRGQAIISAENDIVLTSQEISASVCWFDEKPLNTARKYWLKHTTRQIYAKVHSVDYLWDVHTLSHTENTDTLKLNDIGQIKLKLQQPLASTSYDKNPTTGAFILIDEATHNTVAAGMIVHN